MKKESNHVRARRLHRHRFHFRQHIVGKSEVGKTDLLRLEAAEKSERTTSGVHRIHIDTGAPTARWTHATNATKPNQVQINFIDKKFPQRRCNANAEAGICRSESDTLHTTYFGQTSRKAATTKNNMRYRCIRAIHTSRQVQQRNKAPSRKALYHLDDVKGCPAHVVSQHLEVRQLSDLPHRQTQETHERLVKIWL